MIFAFADTIVVELEYEQKILQLRHHSILHPSRLRIV